MLWLCWAPLLWEYRAITGARKEQVPVKYGARDGDELCLMDSSGLSALLLPFAVGLFIEWRVSLAINVPLEYMIY